MSLQQYQNMTREDFDLFHAKAIFISEMRTGTPFEDISGNQMVKQRNEQNSVICYPANKPKHQTLYAKCAKGIKRNKTITG